MEITIFICTLVLNDENITASSRNSLLAEKQSDIPVPIIVFISVIPLKLCQNHITST